MSANDARAADTGTTTANRSASAEEANSSGACPVRIRSHAQCDPVEVAGTISESGPAPWVDLDGLKVRAVVDPNLARRLLRSPFVSRDARRHYPGYAAGTRKVEGVTGSWVGPDHTLNAYGNTHRWWRAPIQGALTARRVEAMEPVIEDVVRNLLDQIASGASTVDAVEEFAMRVPLLITTRLLGIAPELHQPFRDAVAGVFETGVTPEEADERMARLTQLLEDLVRDKRRPPAADDFTTAMIRQADVGNPQLSDRQLRDQLMLMVSAGLETTVHGIGNLLVDLMTRPDQLHLVTAGDVTWEQAVNESLRYRPPVEWVPLRFAVADFDDPETGEHFEAGDEILINFGSAGRHPKQCPRSPDTFDITRAPVRHLAFGYGPHSCPGAGLARKEIEIAGRRWFETFPKSRLAIPPSDLPGIDSWIIAGRAKIPIDLGIRATR